MKKLFKNGYVFTKNGFEKKDFTIVGNTIRVLDTNIDSFDSIVDCSNKYIVPGLGDAGDLCFGEKL